MSRHASPTHACRHWLRTVFVCALPAFAAPLAEANPDCAFDRSAGSSRQTLPAAQAALANGIVQFDAQRYALAAESIKQALTVGLYDPQERSLAHKYLAFNYCLHGSIQLCEREFELAFEARPDFSLAPHEAGVSAWRDTYRRAAARLSVASCPPSRATFDRNFGKGIPSDIPLSRDPYGSETSSLPTWRTRPSLPTDIGIHASAPLSSSIPLPLGGNVNAQIDVPAEWRYEPRYETRYETRHEPRYETRHEPRYETRHEPRYETRYEPRYEPRANADSQRAAAFYSSHPERAPAQRYRPDLAASQSGLVRLRVQPWASVRIDGKPLGSTPPLTELTLDTGSHSIEFSNGNSPPFRQNIQLRAGETTTITYDFETR